MFYLFNKSSSSPRLTFTFVMLQDHILQFCVHERAAVRFCSPTQCIGAAFAVMTCLSVSLSVTSMYCAQTTESIIVQPSPDCSLAILVFPYHM